MKRVALTSFVWVVSLLMAVAAPVSEQAAKQAALDFIRQQLPALTRGENIDLTRAVTGVADGDDAGIFVFNADAGFVVISADDEWPSVLAYGNGSPYDAQASAPALKALLEAYHYAISAKTLTRAEVPTHSDISPMIKTKWNQNAPYNTLCPNQSPTGCVATAMAQVMYYHKWPNSYDWDKMKTSYKDTDTGEAADAVAKLMADCGTSVFMEYGSNSSSAGSDEPSEALRYDFGYSETTDYVEREAYNPMSWDALIYNELSAKRPVLFSGKSVSSGNGVVGHEFIIDGYVAKSGTGYYHVNWGWGGKSDDYFLLSVLNSAYQYTGGNPGSSGYSYSQSAVIGIQPATEPMEKTTRFSVRNVGVKNDQGSYARASASEDFPAIQFLFDFYNTSKPEEARQYDYAIGLYKDRELVKIIDQGTLVETEYNYGRINCTSNLVSFGSNLANGKYQIRFLSRETGKTTWTWAQKASSYYVELTISGTTMTTASYGRFDPKAKGVFDFTVNSVNYSDSPQEGKTMMITINLTDKNHMGNSPVFLWGNASIEAGDDSYQLLAGGGTNLEPGETGEITLEYMPQRSGTFKFILSGTSDNCNTPLYTFSVEVAAASLADVDISVDKIMAEGADEPTDVVRKVPGQKLTGKVTLTNLGTETYDNILQIYLYENTEAKGTYHAIKYQTVNAKIAVGQTSEFSYTFDDLTINNYYGIIVYAVERGSGKKLNGLNSNTIFKISGGTDISGIEVDDADADVYNLNGVRMGKASEIKSLPKGVYIINKKKIINR